MFSKPSFSFILALALLNLVSGCSTYIEDRASEAFEPVFTGLGRAVYFQKIGARAKLAIS
jgi:hypothetical protein